jgi:hypothetical protein
VVSHIVRRHEKKLRLCVLCGIGLFAIAATIAGSVAAAGAAGGKSVGTFNGCPRGLKALPVTWRVQARAEAREFLTTTYAAWNRERHWGLRLAGAQEGAPFLVRHWLPSGWIKSECGQTVWARSVGVTFVFPAMEYPNPKGPCNACAHVTLLLGKTPTRWVTWGNY